MKAIAKKTVGVSAAKPVSSRPLQGRRVLITRAAGQAGELSAKLRKKGATVISIPAIEIRPPRSYRELDQAIAGLPSYDWLILTSVNGVRAFFSRYQRARSPDAGGETLSGLKIAAIGPATRDAIVDNGYRVAVVPAEYVAEAVVKSLRRRVKGKRVLLVRAKVARDVIPRGLRQAGATVTVVEAYETVVPAKSRSRLRRMLSQPRLRPAAITFTSSSTVKNFMDLIKPAHSAVGAKNLRELRKRLAGIRLASIGPITSATLVEAGLAPHIEARTYTMDGLTEALSRHFAAESKA